MEKQLNQEKINFKRNFYNNNDSGKVYLLSLLMPFVVSLCILLVCQLIGMAMGIPSEEIGNQVWYIIVLYFMTPMTFGAIFLAYNKVAKISYGAINLNLKIGWKKALVAIFVALVAIFGLQFFVGFVDQFLDKIGFTLGDTQLPNDTFGWFALNVLLLAILPAFFEELIFRGVILQGLRKNFSDWLAILLSAIMFTFMHGSLQQFVYPLLLGLILGWIVVRGGSLFLSIIVHFMSNFTVVFMNFLQNKLSFDMNLPSSWWGILISVLLVAVTFVILYLVDRFILSRLNKGKEIKTEKKELVKVPSLFLIISWVVAVILMIISTIVNFI
jgi:membrane protease YdiL (CAAX protease family)